MNTLKSSMSPSKHQLIKYYQAAGEDYRTWSPTYNMHFGYYTSGLNPFDLERMLEQMTLEVTGRLDCGSEPIKLVDLGCGMGASLRSIAQKHPDWSLTGITVVPWQAQQAKVQCDQFKNIQILEADYIATNLEDNSVDAVIAIESSCYAAGSGKHDLIKEMQRILKPGGKFVWADGFLKTAKPMPNWLNKVYQALCNSWALDQLAQLPSVYAQLIMNGFRKVRLEDISWRVAPSVAHVPIKVIKFLLGQLFNATKPMNKYRWNNLLSPILTMILGLAQSYFGYYLVMGTKPE